MSGCAGCSRALHGERGPGRQGQGICEVLAVPRATEQPKSPCRDKKPHPALGNPVPPGGSRGGGMERGWEPGGSPGFAPGLGARAACPALPAGPAWVAWGGCHAWGQPGSSPSSRVGGARGDVSQLLRSRALVLRQSLPVPARLTLSSCQPCVHPSPLVFLPCPGAPHQ